MPRSFLVKKRGSEDVLKNCELEQSSNDLPMFCPGKIYIGQIALFFTLSIQLKTSPNTNVT